MVRIRGVSPEQGSDRRRDLVVIGYLCLLLTALYFDVIFLGNNFFTRDLTQYYMRNNDPLLPTGGAVTLTMLMGLAVRFRRWRSG